MGLGTNVAHISHTRCPLLPNITAHNRWKQEVASTRNCYVLQQSVKLVLWFWVDKVFALIRKDWEP